MSPSLGKSSRIFLFRRAILWKSSGPVRNENTTYESNLFLLGCNYPNSFGSFMQGRARGFAWCWLWCWCWTSCLFCWTGGWYTTRRHSMFNRALFTYLNLSLNFLEEELVLQLFDCQDARSHHLTQLSSFFSCFVYLLSVLRCWFNP